MRLFLALDLPEEIQSQITSLYLPEYQNIRWTVSDQLHLTLVFIGSQSKVSTDEIIHKVAEVELQPFTLETSEIGYFKSGIIWLGVQHCEHLIRLQSKLVQKLKELDLELEHRKFTPHITLGRTKKLDAGLLEDLSSRAFGVRYRWHVESFQLKSSQLSSKGAIYTTEADFLLEC